MATSYKEALERQRILSESKASSEEKRRVDDELHRAGVVPAESNFLGTGGSYTDDQRKEYLDHEASLNAPTPQIPDQPLPGLGESTGRNVSSESPVVNTQIAAPVVEQPAPDYGSGIYKQGLKNERLATENIYNAEAEAAKAQQTELKSQEERFQSIQDQKKAAFDKAQSETDNALQEYKETKLTDPDIWGKASTGGKIALALGALFSSVNNESAKSFRDGIDNAINRDLDIQKNEIAKKKDTYEYKKGSLGDLYKRFGDMELAEQFHSLNTLSQAKAIADQKMAVAKTPLALAKLQKESGQIDMMVQEKKDSFAAKKAEVDLKREENKNKFKDVTFNGEDGFVGMATSAPEATKFRELKATTDSINQGIDQLMKYTDKSFMSNLNPTERAKAEALAKQLVMKIGPLTFASLSDRDQVFMKDLIANPTDIFSLSSSNKAKLQTVKDSVNRDLENKAQSIGLKTPSMMRQKSESMLGIR